VTAFSTLFILQKEIHSRKDNVTRFAVLFLTGGMKRRLTEVNQSSSALP